MLEGLAGSHTRLAIYPALAICYWRVVICASLDTRFKVEVGSDLPGYHQTTKVTLTEVPQKGLGTCIWINKSHILFWMCSSP